MEKSVATRTTPNDRQAAASLASRRQPGASTGGVLLGAAGQRNGAEIDAHNEKAITHQRLVDNSPRVTAQREQMKSAFGMPVQRQGAAEEEEPLQGKFAAMQRQGLEEEEPLQGKFETAQRQGRKEKELGQGKFEEIQRQGLEDEERQMKQGVRTETPTQFERDPAPRENDTGLPDKLKSGIESLSGISLDNVQVHYNSSQPARLSALAYALGTNIHVAPGQENHLPHEAWHVVRQALGCARPTTQLKDGVPINDDDGLEHEADVKGAKAFTTESRSRQELITPELTRGVPQTEGLILQRTIKVNDKDINTKRLRSDIKSISANVAAAINLANANNTQAVDIPSMVNAMLALLRGANKPALKFTDNERTKLENALGNQLSGFDTKSRQGSLEMNAFVELIEIAGATASRTKGTPTPLGLASVPGTLNDKVGAANGTITTILAGLPGVAGFWITIKPYIDSKFIRTAYQNDNGWLPTVPMPGAPGPSQTDWFGYTGDTSTYVEFTVDDSWRIVFNFITGDRYLTLHYNSHAGYNPFFTL